MQRAFVIDSLRLYENENGFHVLSYVLWTQTTVGERKLTIEPLRPLYKGKFRVRGNIPYDSSVHKSATYGECYKILRRAYERLIREVET